MRALIAWVMVAVSAVAVMLDTAFTGAHLSLLSEAAWAGHGWPLIPLAGLGCALMGALVISRYPRQPLGWLLCVASLISVTLAAEAYAAWVLDGDGPGSAQWAHVAAWVGSLLGWPSFTAIVIVFLISPDGQLLSRRWRWALWTTVAGLGLHTLGTLTIRPGQFVYGEQYGARGISAPLLFVGVALVAVGLLASAVSLVLRLRRARDDARRQLLWIASSAVLLAFGVVVVLAVPYLQGEGKTWLAALPLDIAQLAFPLCVAVAVLRHRLVQIDVIVNRAVVLALATGLVAIGYVFVVVVVGSAVGGGTAGFWPSLLTTAVVAMAFQPLRRRVVRVADRLAFGPAATPYEALADFSRRLGDSPNPSALLPAVAEAAAHAVNAKTAAVVLHVEAGPDRRAIWPPGPTSVLSAGVEVPVLDRGERLGSLTVAMPAGHPLRPREHRLLADLADQAALAFRNARLTDDLSGQVERLGQHTRQLGESRRRLISAGDAERSRLERTIARQVVPHLTGLPDRLSELSHLGRRPQTALDPALLDPAVDSLNAALQALREITRGVFPAQLSRSGLPTALRSLLARSETSAQLVVDDATIGRRFDAQVEAAAYFCVAEALRDLGDPIVVRLTTSEDLLNMTVTGGDRGGVPLGHMRDRVEAAGGSVAMTDKDGCTVITVQLPEAARERVPT